MEIITRSWLSRLLKWLTNKLTRSVLVGITEQERAIVRLIIRPCVERFPKGSAELVPCIIGRLRAALRENPYVWVYWYMLGDMYQDIAEWEKALHATQECYRLCPDARSSYALSTAQRFLGLNTRDLNLLRDALVGFTRLSQAPISGAERASLYNTIETTRKDIIFIEQFILFYRREGSP